MSELIDILKETPPTRVLLLALDMGEWNCEKSLAELAALYADTIHRFDPAAESKRPIYEF